MMTTIQTCVRRGKRRLRRWAAEPWARVLLQTLGRAGAGFLLSAAALGNRPMPVALGLVLSLQGWGAVLAGLGGALGYLVFWRSPGVQGVAWMGAGILTSLLLGSRQIVRQTRLLLCAMGCLLVSASGVAFQLWLGDDTPVPWYLLRVLLGGGSTWVLRRAGSREEPVARWLAAGLVTLALAQVWPAKWLCLGAVAGGIAAAAGPMPMAALAGMGLDLANVTAVPMTAVLCLGQLTRLLPGRSRYLVAPAIVGVYLTVAALTAGPELSMLAGLALGAALGTLLPEPGPRLHHRGSAGVLQVRLEMTAAVMSQWEQLLLECREEPIDRQALLLRASERSCGACPARKGCREAQAVLELPVQVLQKPLLDPADLPVRCKKPGRLLTELHRTQEQLRQLNSARERVRECREAVIQQYAFLSEYLRDLSDGLVQRHCPGEPEFAPEVAAESTDGAQGDRCAWFAGTAGRYYILLCDGMGTGAGAAAESADAVDALGRLLRAGYPAQYALRSLNSLCALRNRAGAVSVDLAELYPDTGRGILYKWGAAPSWVIGRERTEKIGTAGPPPGLSVTQTRETAERLSLRRGEALVLVSDGVDGEAVRRLEGGWDLTAGELARKILVLGRGCDGDDASVIAVRLRPRQLST